MTDKDSDDKDSKSKRKFSQEQYDFLLECSKKGKEGIEEWNKWREENPAEEVLLEDAKLRGAYLESADLHDAYLARADLVRANLVRASFLYAHLDNAHIEGTDLRESNLTWAVLDNAQFYETRLENAELVQTQINNTRVWKSCFQGAKLQSAKFENSHVGDCDFSNTVLSNSNLKNAYIYRTHLENANMNFCTLEGSRIQETHFESTKLIDAHLKGACLVSTHLENAYLTGSHLEGTRFLQCYLEGTRFSSSLVDHSTQVLECSIDNETDFRNVRTDLIAFDRGTAELLRYNDRRKNWISWYRKSIWIRWPVAIFWWISDYGHNTYRIFLVFFLLALIFAGFYCDWGRGDDPGIVRNLFVDLKEQEPIAIPELHIPVRAIYFSIVAMTTLGFGDMYANVENMKGYCLLSLQVMLGYILLGALITRLTILFTADGPSAKFTKKHRKGQAKNTKA